MAFLALTPSKLHVRLLGHCRTRDPGVKVREGTRRKANRGKAGCPGAARSPKLEGPGAVKGKGRGGGSGTGPGRSGSGGERPRDSASSRSPRRPSTPPTWPRACQPRVAAQAPPARFRRRCPGRLQPLVSRERGSRWPGSGRRLRRAAGGSALGATGARPPGGAAPLSACERLCINTRRWKAVVFWTG